MIKTHCHYNLKPEPHDRSLLFTENIPFSLRSSFVFVETVLIYVVSLRRERFQVLQNNIWCDDVMLFCFLPNCHSHATHVVLKH